MYKHSILTKINNKYSPVKLTETLVRQGSSVNSRALHNSRKRHISNLANTSQSSLLDSPEKKGILRQTNSADSPDANSDKKETSSPRRPESPNYDQPLTPSQVTQIKQDISFLVDTLRSIAEILIWGDQNDPRVFEHFLEQNIFAHFLNVLYLKLERKFRIEISVQVLQTLNILFENLKLDTSFYFLLSNNHINEIISYNFDFEENEEMLAYYISFLRGDS